MSLLDSLILLACLGSGVMGGFFYAFSGLVMPSLARRPAPEAIATMQTINVVVLNPLFLGLFFGTGAVSIGVIVLAAGSAPLALAGAANYLATIIGVTVAANVPLNNQLAAVDPASEEAASVWASYLRRWTHWNHVRAAGGVISLALFLASLVVRA